MILETRARYFGSTDSVQVAILLQEDDLTSAAEMLQLGTVEVLHGKTTMFSETFEAKHRVMWFEDENYDVPEDRGLFYFFLHHPPVKQNMNVRVSVTMSDARSARQKVAIDIAQDMGNGAWQNPLLGGRGGQNFEESPDFPYRDKS